MHIFKAMRSRQIFAFKKEEFHFQIGFLKKFTALDAHVRTSSNSIQIFVTAHRMVQIDNKDIRRR